MKRMTKKLGAIVLALAMCFSLCCVAFAEDGGEYTITIKDSYPDRTYSAYQIFDATYNDNGDVAYTISSDSAWFELVDGGSFTVTEKDENGDDKEVTYTSPFDLKEAPAGSGVYTVTVKSDKGDQDVIDFFAKYVDVCGPLGRYVATGEGNGEDLVLNVKEPGYYFVTTNAGSLATITTAAPNAEVYDKSTPPGNLEKEIIDGDYWGDHETGDEDIHQDTEAIGDEVKFEVTADVPLYDGAYLVTDYEFDDTLSTGLYLEMAEDEYKVGTGSEAGNETGNYYLTDSVIEKWITIGSASDEDFKLKLTDVDFVGDYYVELTGAYETTNADGETVLIADGFKLYYTTWDTSYDVKTGDTAADIPTGGYPADATITIDYYIHVTESAVYDNTNTIVMLWHETPFNTPRPREPLYGGTMTDKDDIYVLELDVLKVDADDTDVGLEGATFTLEGTNLKDVVVSTKVEYIALSKEEYESAVEAGTVLYFELEQQDADGNPVYTTANPYDLDDPTGYVVDDQDPDYPYVAYTRSVTTGTTVEEADSTTHTVTGTSDSSGKVNFKGLTAGEYTLTEVVAPNGYNLLKDPISIVIKVEYNDEADTVKWTITVNDEIVDLNLDSTQGNVGSFSVTVEDNAGTELPSTGGIGTTIFYIIGGVLVVGAVVVLVTRRRMTRNEG